MSGVVLRCSTCGTTQNHPGACDTCGEGEVRYYCTNHTPGIWADEPTCARCGATFGDPSSNPPAPTRPFSTTSPAPTRREIPKPVPVPPPPRPADRPRPDLRAPTAPDPEPEHIPGALSLGELLAHLAREGTPRPYKLEGRPPRERRRSRGGLGCLKFVIFVILLIIFTMGGCF